jgi:hypothetical protein
LNCAALRDSAARTAALWQTRGLQPGDHVAIALPDGWPNGQGLHGSPT